MGLDLEWNKGPVTSVSLHLVILQEIISSKTYSPKKIVNTCSHSNITVWVCILNMHRWEIPNQPAARYFCIYVGYNHWKYEDCISYGSKVIAKVKVDNGQTDRTFERASLVEYACQIWRLYIWRFKNWRQTGQKQYAPIIRSGGIKKTQKHV